MRIHKISKKKPLIIFFLCLDLTFFPTNLSELEKINLKIFGNNGNRKYVGGDRVDLRLVLVYTLNYRCACREIICENMKNIGLKTQTILFFFFFFMFFE